MRRTVFGLAAAAVLVFAACGGDDDSSADDNGGSETNEAAGGDASPSSPEAARFCDEFMELTQQGATGASPDDVVEAMRALDPPEEIADDFALTIEGTELQAQMAAGEEPDPELQAQFQEREQEYQEANMSIQQFLSEECQIGAPPPQEPDESDS